jgi:hypothetical protein
MLKVIEVRPLSERDRSWDVQVEAGSWSEPLVVRLGQRIDPRSLPGFIALLDEQRAGLASYAAGGEE